MTRAVEIKTHAVSPVSTFGAGAVCAAAAEDASCGSSAKAKLATANKPITIKIPNNLFIFPPFFELHAKLALHALIAKNVPDETL